MPPGIGNQQPNPLWEAGVVTGVIVPSLLRAVRPPAPTRWQQTEPTGPALRPGWDGGCARERRAGRDFPAWFFLLLIARLLPPFQPSRGTELGEGCGPPSPSASSHCLPAPPSCSLPPAPSPPDRPVPGTAVLDPGSSSWNWQPRGRVVTSLPGAWVLGWEQRPPRGAEGEPSGSAGWGTRAGVGAGSWVGWGADACPVPAGSALLP